MLDGLRQLLTKDRRKQCGRVMVGSGTDTYDPICQLPAGHGGECKSTAATDQHRIGPAEWSRAWGLSDD